MQVNIYIETDSSLRSTQKRFGYVLECKIRGEPVTREGFGTTEGTKNAVTLQAITEALARIRQPCEITIYTQNTFIANMFTYQLPKWVENEFHNRQGKEIANRQQWEQIWEASKKHNIKITPGKHQFSEWITEQLNRRQL